MYPANYFGLFPPFPCQDTVFVAMSFDSQYDRRWLEVIAPAVRSIEVNGKRLEPLRVDARRISDSILTEILAGIGNSRLVLADVTTLERIGDRAIRNGNVMYEVGIAHATRLPEEVLIFRSDSDRVLFDLANIRVNTYSPDDTPEAARTFVTDCMIAALNEVELRKHLAVTRAADSLGAASWWLLSESATANGVAHPPAKTMRQVLGNAPRAAAIQQLLEMGAIRSAHIAVTPEIYEEYKDRPPEDAVKYHCTEFGRALVIEVTNRMGLGSVELRTYISERGKGTPPSTDPSVEGA